MPKPDAPPLDVPRPATPGEPPTRPEEVPATPGLLPDGRPLEPPLEFPLRVFFIERNFDGLFEDLRHILKGILHTEDLGKSFELLLEFFISRETEVENISFRGLE